MKIKNTMIILSVITGLVGSIFLFFPKFITTTIFPEASEEGIIIGVYHRQVIGTLVYIWAVYHWIMRDVGELTARRFLFGSGLCFLINALIVVKISLIDNVTEFPYIPFAFLFSLSIYAFINSRKISQ